MSAGFDLLERLGSGYFGEVWLAEDIGLAAKRALKIIPPERIVDKNNLFSEAKVLQKAAHQNVVKIFETGEMTDGDIYIAMEYLKKGSLEDEAKGAYVPLTRAKSVMIDILRGLQYAHDQKILHRDIKPANILIGNAGEGKLSDFGLSIPKGINLSKLGIKDYKYMYHLAPEVPRGTNYSEITDIYACGITLYRLVNGDKYLPNVSPEVALSMAGNGEFPNREKYRAFITSPLRKLINRAMDPNPIERFQSAEQMRRALERIAINKNWQEKQLANGIEWTSSWDNQCFYVACLKLNSKWTVIVKKGGSKKQLRRINALCVDALSESKARKKAARVLQDFVLGKQ